MALDVAAGPVRHFTVLGSLCILLLLVANVVAATERGSSRLVIVVEGVRNSRGVIGALLFTSSRGWPEDVAAAVRARAVPSHPGTTTLAFDGLSHIPYAAVVLHDENENKKLDRLFGVPREGWGMSNNPKPHAAAPAFGRARFVLRRNTRIRIHLNY